MPNSKYVRRREFTVEQLLEQTTTADSGCRVWTGASINTGYGHVWSHGKMWLTHRLIYTLAVGPIPHKLEIDHLCRTRLCLNIQHLEVVTHQENNRRRAEHWMKTVGTCPYGHEYTPENSARRGKKQLLVCRTCERNRGRIAYQKIRTARAA